MSRAAPAHSALSTLTPQLSTAFFCLSLFLLALISPARAAPIDFNVPAQLAGDALLAFSQQANIEIVFSSDDLRQVRSNPLAGRRETEAALDLLLKNTGYVARRLSPGKYIVAPAPPSPGAIKGRLVTSDGTSARGARVAIIGTRLVTTTNGNGEFSFDSVPPGTHQLAITGRRFQPLQLTNVRAEAGNTLTLETQIIRLANETAQLQAVVVEARSAKLRPFDRNQASSAPRVAAGNLDLPRTQDDALPYVIYDREQIARSGTVNLNDFLQREVVDSDAATRPLDQTPGEANDRIAGSSNQQLRGYGSDETIVLLNGRRLPEIVTGTTATSNGKVVQQPDINFIPLSLVQRVEVLPVSASALYSGNPVGGVINIVLRPNADVTEVTTTYTNTLGHFDAPQSTVSLQHGRTLLDGKLHLRLSATFTTVEPATEAELGFVRAHLTAPATLSDSVYRATPNLRGVDLVPLFGPGTSPLTSVAPGADGSGGLAAFSNRQGRRSLDLFNSVGGLANFSASVDFPYGRRQKGSSFFGSVTYDLFPWLQLGADAITTHTVFNRGFNVFKGDLSLSATSPLNPFGQDLNVSLLETAPQLGETYSEAQLDFSSFVLGALIKLPADWRVSLDGQYGRNLTRYRGLAGVDSTRWQQLVDDGVYNPLRDTQAFGPPAAFYDRAVKYYGARGRFVTLGDYETVDAALRLTNQALLLPTGSSSVTVGGDYRLNHLAPYSGIARFGDGSLAGAPSPTLARTIERISVFGELQAPLLPARWLPSWISNIKTEIAARYVVSDSAQESNLAPTGGLKIDFAGGFSLRSTIATSNRLPPPTLSRAAPVPVTPGSGSGEISYVSVTDPLRGNEKNDFVVSSELINSNLRPESAVTRTIGLIFQRGQVHRIRTALDIADTRKSGEQSFLNASTIVGLESSFPGRVERAAPAAGESAGKIVSVLTGTFNLAYRHSQNWSGAVDYAWTECFGGRLDVYGRWLYFQRYELQLLPGSPTVDEIRFPDGAAPGLLRHRVNFGSSWSTPRFGFGWDGHYFHSRKLSPPERAVQGDSKIDPFWQFDAYTQTDLARFLPWKNSRFGLRGQLRVNNLFNEAPPRYAAESSGVGVQSYGDWRGRVYSISVTATF